MIYRESGEFLKSKRIKNKLTQKDLGYALGYRSPQFVSNWERGLCYPALESLPQLSKLLKVPHKELAEIVLKDIIDVAVVDMGLNEKVKVTLKVG